MKRLGAAAVIIAFISYLVVLLVTGGALAKKVQKSIEEIQRGTQQELSRLRYK